MALVNDFGESKVTVKKEELLKAVRKNREGHRVEFLKAQEGYRAAIIKELDGMLQEAREGKRIRRNIELVEPQDHTRDYDRIICMLSMSTADEIVVSEQQFSQFVLDEWGWMASFKGSTARYLG